MIYIYIFKLKYFFLIKIGKVSKKKSLKLKKTLIFQVHCLFNDNNKALNTCK